MSLIKTSNSSAKPTAVQSDLDKIKLMIIKYIKVDYACPPNIQELRKLCRNVDSTELCALILRLTRGYVRDTLRLQVPNQTQLLTYSCFHFAAFQQQVEMLYVMLESLSDGQKVKLLTKLALSGNISVSPMSLLLGSEISICRVVELVSTVRDAQWKTKLLSQSLSIASSIAIGAGKAVEALLKERTIESKYEFLCVVNKLCRIAGHSCPTHIAATTGNADVFPKLLTALTVKEIMSVLSFRSPQSLDTVLHVASANRHSNVVHSIVNSLRLENVCDLMKLKNKGMNTVLHLAAVSGDVKLFESFRLKELIGTPVIEELLLQPGCQNGKSVLQIAEDYGNSFTLKYCAQLLEPHQSRQPESPNADIQSPLDNRTDEINRQLQQINQLQNDVEIPQQAVIKLQDLLKSTDEQVEKLRHEKEKLKSKIHELEKQQTEKHQQQLSHNQDVDTRFIQLSQKVSENTGMIDTLTNEITGLRSQVTVLETQSLLINTTLTAQTDHQEYLTARVDSQAGQQANLAAGQVNLSGLVDELRNQQANQELETLENEGRLREVESHVAVCRKRKKRKYVDANQPSTSDS